MNIEFSFKKFAFIAKKPRFDVELATRIANLQNIGFDDHNSEYNFDFVFVDINYYIVCCADFNQYIISMKLTFTIFNVEIAKTIIAFLI